MEMQKPQTNRAASSGNIIIHHQVPPVKSGIIEEEPKIILGLIRCDCDTIKGRKRMMTPKPGDRLSLGPSTNVRGYKRDISPKLIVPPTPYETPH